MRMTLQAAIVLRALSDGHRYGFDIMDHTGLPDGSIYPILRRLQRAGMVTSEWEAGEIAHAAGRPPRRYHALTEGGRAALQEATERYPLLHASGIVEPSEA